MYGPYQYFILVTLLVSILLVVRKTLMIMVIAMAVSAAATAIIKRERTFPPSFQDRDTG